MINEITYIESAGTNPYENLALEEYLFFHCREEQCILYLWQNQKTVVIGRNQNAWKECLLDELKEDGGHLARRLSGGGAVYQDLGNLNFTFLVRKANYDLERQLAVIVQAVSKAGIHAEKSGRNDILADGRKFSGNACYRHGDYCYHHGTVMVDVDIQALSRYLTVSKEKLKTKGIDSVRARVTNLTAFVPELSVTRLKGYMLQAFEEIYGLKAKVETEGKLDGKSLEKSREKFGSWDWNFGRKIPFSNEFSRWFSWGGISVQMQVKDGVIETVQVWSDSMKPDLIGGLGRTLKDTRYDKGEICGRLRRLAAGDVQENEMKEDIIAWFQTVEL